MMLSVLHKNRKFLPIVSLFHATIRIRLASKGAPMTNYLLIFGGSGFIGQSVCREAIKHEIAVVSISPSGPPQDHYLRNHPLITWIKGDIFTSNLWHDYLPNAYAVINLIGILHEQPRKKLFYVDLIFTANQLIADQVRHYPQIPYLFLSANAGGPLISPRYIENKRRAEAYLLTLTNPIIIFRPGLVVGTDRPFSLIEGSAVYILAHLPILKKIAQPIYPIGVTRLANRLIQESHATISACLTPDKL